MQANLYVARRWRDPVQRAADIGMQTLANQTYGGQGLQSSLSLSPDFGAVIPAPALRGAVLQRFGLDLGFDPSAEHFSSMLAARMLWSRGAPRAWLARLVDSFETRHFQRRYRFFHDSPGFAADTDCSGVALAALWHNGRLPPAELIRGALQIADCRAPLTADCAWPGALAVYWDDGMEPGALPRGLRQDACAAANALVPVVLARTHLGEAGLSDAARADTARRLDAAIEPTLDWLAQELARGGSSRYYPSPDALLCFVSELLRQCPTTGLRLRAPLRQAVSRRLEMPGSTLDLSMRLLAACACGVVPVHLQQALVEAQDEDGLWPAAPLFTLGRVSSLHFGSRTLSAAFAVAALREARP